MTPSISGSKAGWYTMTMTGTPSSPAFSRDESAPAR